jgi:hypothetical protein
LAFTSSSANAKEGTMEQKETSAMKTGSIFQFASALLWLFISGYSSAGIAQSFADRQDYIQKVQAFPVTFIISNSDSAAADAWGRAESLVALYSAMQLHIVTDYVIETDNPQKDDLSFAYLVVRTPMNNSFQFTVICRSSGRGGSEADMNAHILAYYIKTGELPYPGLISR